MKNKKIYIIIGCLVIIFIVLSVIGFIIKKRDDSSNIKTFKNFVFEVDETIKYNKISKYSFELKSNKWYAVLEPLFDEYGHILSYPKCTQRFFDKAKNYSTNGEIKYASDDKNKYISFQMEETENGNIINNVVVHYELSDNYVMLISLVNNDNSFNEEGLKDIFKVLKTIKINSKGKYDYNYYDPEFYHQCHDIDQYDAEEFERAIENDAKLNEQANDSENTPSNEETQKNQEETSENTNSTEE